MHRIFFTLVLLLLVPDTASADVDAWASGQVVLDKSQPGRLLGRVTESRSGESLAGLTLELLRPARTQGRSFPEPWVAQGSSSKTETLAQVTTAGDGSFRFEGLSLGRYRIRALSAARTHGGEEATLSAEHPVRTVSLSLDLGRSISGRVIDETGKPLNDMFVFLSGLDSGDGRNSINPEASKDWTQSGEDGSFTLMQLPDGILHVQAARRDYGFSLPKRLAEAALPQDLKIAVPDERDLLQATASGGIGVSLRFTPLGPELSRVVPEMPAAEAGLQKGDLVLSINGRATRFMSAVEFVARCRGDEGSSLVLVVERDGESRQVLLKRAVLPY